MAVKKISDRQIKNCHKKGMSQVEIAEKFGLTRAAIHQRFKKLGLKPGARMIIPVGRPFAVQSLMLVEKDATGEVRTRQLLPVRFVPLTGDH